MTEIEVKEIQLVDGTYHLCKKCGGVVDWQDCWNCEGGFSYHDCGDDCCVCRNPEPNVVCDICDGKGGWWVCLNCNPGDAGEI